MSASRDPIFAQLPFSFQKNLTAAKTSRTGVTNATLLYQAGPEGALITRLAVRPNDTVASATRVDFYTSPDNSAALPVASVLTGTPTVSATADIPEYRVTQYDEDTPLRLGPNEALYAGLSAAFASGMICYGQGETLTSPALASITKAEGTATT